MRIAGSIPPGGTQVPLDEPDALQGGERAAADGTLTAGAPAATASATGLQGPSRMDVQRQLLERTLAVEASAGTAPAVEAAGAGKHAALRAAFEGIDAPSGPSTAYRIDRNVEAFASRWRTLEGATKTFDTTYFIWENDVFGMAYLGHMFKKARHGVAVRGMLDATGDAAGTKGFKGTFRGQDYLQELVAVDPKRVQFGIFNPVLKKDLTSLRSMIASNHDKLAIADGEVVETGGRNMAAHYFSDPKDHEGVYRDTDLHVESPVAAKSATAAFDAEFDEPIVQKIKPDRFGNLVRRDIELLGTCEMMDHWLKSDPLPEDVKAQIRAGNPPQHLVDELVEHAVAQLPIEGINRAPDERELAKLREMASELVGNPELRGTYHTEHKRFDGEVKVIDNVSVSSTGENQISDALLSLIDAAQESIYIHNPYVVLTDRALNALAEAGKRGVEVVFGTNSPESTDSAITQAYFQEDWPLILARIPNSRIIVATGDEKHHAKSFVVDGVLTGVSTYNADWISARVNSEVVTLEWSEELAADTVDSYHATIADPAHDAVEYKILRDAEGRALLLDGEPVVEFGPEDHTPPEELKKKYGLLRRAADLAREYIPDLKPLKHPPLSEATDNVRAIDWKKDDAGLRELAASGAGRRALEGKIGELESGWTTGAEAKQIDRLRSEITRTATVDERTRSIEQLFAGHTTEREEGQVRHILTTAAPGDLSAILDGLSAERLADELDDGDLGAVLARLAGAAQTGRNGQHLAALLRHVDDDATRSMMECISDAQLQSVARAPGGKAAIARAIRNLEDGWTTGSERKQIRRLERAR